jgi:hypothetical protein
LKRRILAASVSVLVATVSLAVWYRRDGALPLTAELGSARATVAPPDWDVYQSKAFSAACPPDWETMSELTGPTQWGCSMRNDGWPEHPPNCNVFIDRDDGSPHFATLEAYWEQTRDVARREIPSFEVYEERETTWLGVPAIRAQVSHAGGGAWYDAFAYYAKRAGVVIVATCTVPPDLTAAYTPDLELLLQYFNVSDLPPDVADGSGSP